MSRDRSAAGFLLVQSAVAMTLTAILLHWVASATLFPDFRLQPDERGLSPASRADLGVRRLRQELVRSSLAPDAMTGAHRILIEGAEGDRSITFQRAVNLVEAENEIVASWSTPITYRRRGDDLVRSQDGREITLLRNVPRLEFQIVGKRVEIQVCVRPDGGDARSPLSVQQTLVQPAF